MTISCVLGGFEHVLAEKEKATDVVQTICIGLQGVTMPKNKVHIPMRSLNPLIMNVNMVFPPIFFQQFLNTVGA